MFKPTFLYVKTHNKTKLKYFGKTVNKNPKWYKGSGTRWLNHINYHGNDVTTEVIGYFIDEQECKDFAVRFSKDNDIVESNDWANLEIEDGLNGGFINPMGKNNTQYDTIWITNGQENKKNT